MSERSELSGKLNRTAPHMDQPTQQTSSNHTDFVVIRNLTKRFRPGVTWGHWLSGTFRLPPVVALDSISLRIPTGLVGLAGPNGAGKTTLLRAMAGLLRPDEGSITIAGQPVRGHDPRFRSRVGYAVSGERSHFWRLSGRENLAFFGALHGKSRVAALARADELLDVVGLADAKDRAVREYSTGMTQRLSLARGLLGTPSFLLLDEPTRGLDPGNAERLRTLVADVLVAERGLNVLWATHDLEEMRSFCTSLIVLEDGRVAADGTFDAVQDTLSAVFE